MFRCYILVALEYLFYASDRSVGFIVKIALRLSKSLNYRCYLFFKFSIFFLFALGLLGQKPGAGYLRLVIQC